MFVKLSAWYFAAFGFSLTSVVSLMRGADLLVSLQRGLIALAGCWILGLFSGFAFYNIIADKPVSTEKSE